MLTYSSTSPISGILSSKINYPHMTNRIMMKDDQFHYCQFIQTNIYPSSNYHASFLAMLDYKDCSDGDWL